MTPGDVATAAPAAATGLLPAALIDDGGAPVTTPRTPAREAADRELSKGEYHRDDHPGLLNRVLDWLWDHISSLLNSAAQASPGGWVGLTVIIFLLVLLALALRMRLGRLRYGPSADTTLFEKGPRSAAEHRTTAETHAAAGRWNEALQERMRAIVRSLEERALLDHRPGRTADEAALEAGRALPEHADALRSAARSFDEVTYADRHIDAAAYTTVRELDSALQRAEFLLPGTSGAQDTGTLVAPGVQGTDAGATTQDGGSS